MERTILFLTAMGSAVLMLAQPTFHGCHFGHNAQKSLHVLSDAERALVNASIARSDTFDILHYDITIDVTDYSGASIRAATKVSFTPKLAGQDHIRFDLYQLTVDSVIMNGTSLLHSYDGEVLQVEFPTVPLVGDTSELTVHYQGNPHRDPDWGGFYFEANYIYNLGIGLTTIPPNFGKVWYPCFDSFVERATYTYHVTSADGYKAHCQGAFLGETVLNGDTVLREFDFSHPIPTHASAIAVSDYVDFDTTHLGAYGNVPLRLSGKPGQINGMKNKFADIYGTIDALEYWYGANPFERVGFVLTTDGALEIPENIAFPQFMVSQSNQANRELMAHELGHHWWGDHVTPYSHEHMWLKEGPAEYSQHLVEEWIGGREAFVDMVKDNQKFILEDAHVNDGGFQPLSPMPDPYIYGTHTYYKGASVMHNLRGYLGDTLFRQAMTQVQTFLADTVMDPIGFRDALEAASGVDLDDLFNDQVLSPGYSVFVVDEMEAVPSGNQWEVTLDIRQLLRAAPDFYHNVPLDVTLLSPGLTREEYQIVADDAFTSVTLNCPFEPFLAVLNGNARLNQARLDHEFNIIPGESFNALIPYVDMRIDDEVIVDSAFVRVEHIWAGPERDQIGWGIDAIADGHYWIVDGIFPEGNVLSGRVLYDGGSTTDLDHLLMQGYTEDQIFLAYREDALGVWEYYPDQHQQMGSPNDLRGYLYMDTLRRGQYAFGVGGAIASINDPSSVEPASLFLHPVPASTQLIVSGEAPDRGFAQFNILSVDGRSIDQSHAYVAGVFKEFIDVRGLAAGSYVLHIEQNGRFIGSAPFVIAN